MLASDLQTALRIITDTYEKSISEYLRKIIIAERHGGVLEAAEVISMAFIVLDRAHSKYDQSKGPFRNYAIRALRNEFIRYKTTPFCLYEDFQDKDIVASAENSIADNNAWNSPLTDGESAIEYEIRQKQLAASHIMMSATLMNASPLEQALIYFSFYTQDSTKTNSLHEVSKMFSISYYKLTKILTTTLAKLESAVQKP